MVVPTVAAITARRSWRAASSLVICSCRPGARLLISSPYPLLGGIGSRLRSASSAPGSTSSHDGVSLITLGCHGIQGRPHHREMPELRRHAVQAARRRALGAADELPL